MKLGNEFIATVWIANGLLCKVLNLVPRHAEIVARILGPAHSSLLTRVIGTLEILMALWVLSGKRRRLAAIAQISIIAAMNILELFLAPDLLLWGRMNSVFAFLFILFISWNEFGVKNPD